MKLISYVMVIGTLVFSLSAHAILNSSSRSSASATAVSNSSASVVNEMGNKPVELDITAFQGKPSRFTEFYESTPHLPANPFMSTNGPIKAEAIDDLNKFIFSQLQQYPYFLKDSTYAHQCEYRYVWLLSHDVDDYLDIKVPEAIPFCCAPNVLTD